MRKKLLALLMCATMVLGTAATASAATPGADDYTNAAKILNAYDGQYITKELDAKSGIITFATTYKDDDTNVTYTWAVQDKTGTIVKVNPNKTSEALTKTNGKTYDVAAMDNTKHVLSLSGTWGSDGVTNPSTSLANNVGSSAGKIAVADLNGSVFKNNGDNTLYYVTATTLTAAATLSANQYIVVDSTSSTDEVSAAPNYAVVKASSGDLVVTLEQFTAAETGTVNIGYDVIPKTGIKDTYGMDKDGYILRAASTISFKPLSGIADGYYAEIASAKNSGKNADVAQALADGVITKNAAAVSIDFYQFTGDSKYTRTTQQGTTGTETAYASNGTQSGFMTLIPVEAAVSDTAVTFKADWLSRSNVKNANVVYLLDPRVTTVSSYFDQYSTVWKIADLANDTFTSKYIASGIYIFDYVESESQNDGVSDTDTTATTTASTTAATSPKTGDVAPIAALAVVMMGACGAMVVASKKRA